jgi:uncharacterized protein (DUF983 family)
MAEKAARRSYLSSALGCRCPRCRQGKLFEYPLDLHLNRILKMHKNCLVCGQPFEIEVGFYYGTSFVSYALTVAMSVGTLIAWWMTIGLSTEDNRFFYWIAANAVLLILLQPWFMRVSRSLWISWFVRYDPDWKSHPAIDVSERMNSDQANNW